MLHLKYRALRTSLPLLFVALGNLYNPAFASDEPGSVTLYRDTYGVPYIFAATDADAAYGLGYAQAQDRLGDLYINVRTAIGTMSEAFGEKYITQDYAMRISKNAERSEARWTTVDDTLKAIGESFVRGVNAYIEEHPEDVPEWSLELHAWHSVAIGQAMILSWPLGGIQDELNDTLNSNGFGSNQWAVSPERSAEGCAILLTDPHLTWEGLAVFTEAHVFGAELEMHGFFIVGTPLLALGHNGHVGWAATTGGPDTADVYRMKLNPQNPLQYEYDGEWRTATLEMIKINVKGQEPVTRPAGFTHLGPMFSQPDYKNHVVYVGATPYFDTAGLFEQTYEMCRAKNADEFYEALAMNEYMGQNVMFADREGTIQYVRTGRTPIRPAGYDWSKAVPGHTSATKWMGIHDIKDLVQIKNPAQGYMQNCNISPGKMMHNSPMKPDRYPDYIYNVSWDYMNTRGTRTLDILHRDDEITKADAMAIAFDVYDILAPAWQNALRAALETVGANRPQDAEFDDAVEKILAWDGQFVKESSAAPIVQYWRANSYENVDIDTLLANESLSQEDQTDLLKALRLALATMNTRYGTTDITWGAIHKIGRGGKLFDCDGAVLGRGASRTRTLLNVAGRETEEGSGVYVGYQGSMSMVLMFFHEDGIESYTCTQWGQSAHPESPHHVDQAEHLYSQRKFKQVWSNEEELLEHVESKTVLSTT